MSTYSSKPHTASASAGTVYSRINNLGSLQERINALPEDIRSKLGEVTFTDDSIVINAGPVGAITFNVVERIEPTRVALEAQNSPVPLRLSLNLTPKDADHTDIVTTIDIDIPMMLRPIVGPKMQEAADKLGELVGNINYNA